jgi:Cu+-exporting ATPase
MATAIDPICAMDVDTDNPPGGQSEYQGTNYYFCASGCKAAFDNEPEKYLAEDGAAADESDGQDHSGHDHGHCHSHGGHHTPENQPANTPAKKPGLLARLFGRK